MDENKVEVQETEKPEKFAKVKAFFGRAGKFCADHVGDAVKIVAGAAGGFALAHFIGGGDVIDAYYSADEDADTDGNADDSVEDVD